MSVIPENQPTRVRRNEEVETKIGERIRAARKHRKMSLAELGNELGLTYQQVQKYETGQNRISASTLLKLAEILGVEITYFFADCMTTEGGHAASVARIPANPYAPLELHQVEDDKIRARLLDLVDAIADMNVQRRKSEKSKPSSLPSSHRRNCKQHV